MNQYFKWGLIATLFVATVMLIRFFALIYYAVSIFPNDATICFDETDIISQNTKGDKIERQITTCDGIANSCSVSLNLIPADTGKKITFFSYDFENDYPVVSWESDRVLDVEVAHVAEVFKNRKHAGDIEVRYKIDHDSSPWWWP